MEIFKKNSLEIVRKNMEFSGKFSWLTTLVCVCLVAALTLKSLD